MQLPGHTPMEPGIDWPLSWGTVGWDDDGGNYFDLGDGSKGESGRTLVRVQLFAGRNPTVALDQTIAQGHKLICQLAGGFFRIPPKGTRVLVAVPHPYGNQPGASVIVATSEPSPAIQFAKNRVVIDVGPDTHLVLRAKSVSMQSYSTPAQFVSVGQPFSGGPPGVYALDETGSGFGTQSGEVAIFACDSNGVVQSTCHLTKDTAEILQKGTQTCGMQAKAGDCVALGANFRATCAMVFLGIPTNIAGPPTNSVHFGPPGPGAPSTTVFAAT